MNELINSYSLTKRQKVRMKRVRWLYANTVPLSWLFFASIAAFSYWHFLVCRFQFMQIIRRRQCTVVSICVSISFTGGKRHHFR